MKFGEMYYTANSEQYKIKEIKEIVRHTINTRTLHPVRCIVAF